MPKLPQVKARELVKVVLRLGFTFRDQSGSHAIYMHPDGRRTVVPVHGNEDLGPGLLNEILKQNWENTLKVEEQVIIIFAAVKGLLDKVDVKQVVSWEEFCLEFFRSQHADILQTIAQEQKLSEAVEKELTQIITHFNQAHPQFLIQTQT